MRVREAKICPDYTQEHRSRFQSRSRANWQSLGTLLECTPYVPGGFGFVTGSASPSEPASPSDAAEPAAGAPCSTSQLHPGDPELKGDAPIHTQSDTHGWYSGTGFRGRSQG